MNKRNGGIEERQTQVARVVYTSSRAMSLGWLHGARLCWQKHAPRGMSFHRPPFDGINNFNAFQQIITHAFV